MTNPCKGKIRTVEEADELVRSLGFTELVEEYELEFMEHVYTLIDGLPLIVPTGADEEPYILGDDCEHITPEEYLEGMKN